MRANGILLPTAIFGIALAALVRFADGAGAEPIARILTLGVLGVVPLGLLVVSPLRAATRGAEEGERFEGAPGVWGRIRAVAAFALPLAGGSAVVSLWQPTGPAGFFVAPWVALALLIACLGIGRVSAEGRRRPDRWVSGAALVYLPVGAAWLVASRMGLRPLGFDPMIVALTAVHFHFAAFASPIFAARVMRALDGGPEKTLAQIAGIGIIVAIPLTAVGFMSLPLVGLVGACLLAGSLLTHAVLVLTRVQRSMKSTAARVLLGIAGLSLFLSMPLAVLYQWGRVTETAPIDIAWMIRLHGFANAHGFATCGLLAFVIEDRRTGKSHQASSKLR